jgi:VanZ family protein
MTPAVKLSIINKNSEVIVRLALRQKITISVLVLYWIALVIVSHIPIPQIVYRAQVSDKWLHFLAYLNLVFLLWFSVRPDRRVSWRSGIAWLLLVAAAAYGGIDELLQPFVGRTCDFWDFMANAEGILAGLVVFSFLTFWQALPAVSAITIFGLTNLARANLSKLMPVTIAFFHIFAYGCFAFIWIVFMNLYMSVKPLSARLLLAIGVPVGLLFVVKGASLVLGRHFAGTDLMFAILGIVCAVGAAHLTGLLRCDSNRQRLKRE